MLDSGLLGATELDSGLLGATVLDSGLRKRPRLLESLLLEYINRIER